MVRALDHRGPDDVGIAVSSRAALGATRLAIRGVSNGHQPFVDPPTGVTVVCNGEIDNHAELRAWLEERGRAVHLATDAAVIPGLYLELGEAFVERLVGAFAVAVWDPRADRLLLARDRTGERPLFFLRHPDFVVFASELAALASDPTLTLTRDRDSLGAYLRSGLFASPSTPFAEVRKVAPGETVTFDAAGVRRRRYWRWSVGTTPKGPPNEERFDAIFREAVRRQTEVDVDFGVLLSGGLDSSLVATVARRLRPERPLLAYTVRFREASYDEGRVADRVAHRLGIRSIPVWIEPEQFPEQIRELVATVGEPLADPAWVPTAMLCRRAAADVKLALTGEGADEIFGGYPTYLGARWASRYARLPGPLRALVARILRRWPPSDRKVALSFLLKRFVDAAEMEGLTRHVLWTSQISPVLLRRLGATRPFEPPEDRPQGDLLDLVQRADLEGSLAEGLLTKADRASMAHGMEVRAPFLDVGVIEYAASLPPEARVRGLSTKVFLKRYALRYLPGSIVHRRKRGLSVPLASWMRGPLHGWVRSRLADERLEAAGVRPAAALDVLEEHRLRTADHSRALWTLVVLVEWLRWTAERSSRGEEGGADRPESHAVVLVPVPPGPGGRRTASRERGSGGRAPTPIHPST